jgi:hypothetical protein
MVRVSGAIGKKTFQGDFYKFPAKNDIFLENKSYDQFLGQGCQIGTIYPNGKNIPNNKKMYQRATKYTKIFH